MFEPNASWSLPEHLFMVSEWSALCSKAGDPMSCVDALQSPVRPDGATKKAPKKAPQKAPKKAQGKAAPTTTTTVAPKPAATPATGTDAGGDTVAPVAASDYAWTDL